MQNRKCPHLPRFLQIRISSRRRVAAFSLVESVIAMAISFVTLGAALQLNAQQLKLVKSTRESNASSFLLQDRAEQFRILSWRSLTDATFLRDNFLSTQPASAALLPNVSEQVKLTPWPDATAGKPILVEYTAGSAPEIMLTGLDSAIPSRSLSQQRMAKVDMVVTWTGKDNRQRKRSYSSIISNSGVTRTSLPAFGGPTGAPPFSATPTPLPDGTTPAATPTPAPTPTPTPTPSENGNSGNGNGGGNGRGNAGGQSGKK